MSGRGCEVASAPANANGHRRRELRARVRAEESVCALCGKLVDKAKRYLKGKHGPRCRSADCTGCVPDPMRGEVDEDLPRSRGGDPLLRSNTRLMHRKCNRWKGTMTLAEAREKFLEEHGEERPAPVPSPIW